MMRKPREIELAISWGKVEKVITKLTVIRVLNKYGGKNKPR